MQNLLHLKTTWINKDPQEQEITFYGFLFSKARTITFEFPPIKAFNQQPWQDQYANYFFHLIKTGWRSCQNKYLRFHRGRHTANNIPLTVYRYSNTSAKKVNECSLTQTLTTMARDIPDTHCRTFSIT